MSTSAIVATFLRPTVNHAQAPLQPRAVLEISRAAEYVRLDELEKQTGQPKKRFAAVILKELLDNALDAAEAARVAPVLTVELAPGNDGHTQIYVTDNGIGLSRDAITKILNFTTRASDKAAWRSPTRGAQGNAFKTVLGIPTAFGIDDPIIVTACGLEHEIRLHAHPAGVVDVIHTEQKVPPTPGTTIRVTLPTWGQEWDPEGSVRAFALFNPHASVKICTLASGELACSEPIMQPLDFYQPTVDFPTAWRKYVTGDSTSAWWYSVEALRQLISGVALEARARGEKAPLPSFVAGFKNLSAKPKWKQVCATVPAITHLGGFDTQQALVPVLHKAMQHNGAPPSPDVLGRIGEDHFRTCFDAWYGIERFWYATEDACEEGIPCVVEVAVAETRGEGTVSYGLNFSPTYDDPFSRAHFSVGPDNLGWQGVWSVLGEGHVYPSGTHNADVSRCRAVAVHVVCPALTFLDRAKTLLDVPAWVKELLAKALWRAIRTLYQEGKKREANAAKQWREERTRQLVAEKADQAPVMTLVEAVFAVLPEAWTHATGDGQYRVSARNLYYAVRDRIQALTPRELEYDYFSQALLTRYQQEYGAIQGLYYDPRGMLYEPHTGRAIVLGTCAVEEYQFPAWSFDKILYVEKRTVWPTLETAQFAERYDMAIVTGEGYATEAIRVLFAQASRDRQYQLFVLHDADPYGYNIARTLREATDRMPGYAVEVIDLGLFVEDAMALGKRPETFTRKNALPKDLLLSEATALWFEGRVASRNAKREPASWICERVELNALTAPELVAYIDHQLQAAGVRGKVIPPEAVIQGTAKGLIQDQLETLTRRALNELLDQDAILEEVVRQFQDTVQTEAARDQVVDALTKAPTRAWDTALRNQIADKVHPLYEDIRDVVETLLHRPT